MNTRSNVILGLSVGSDPEVFLRGSTGRLVSSIGIIPGSKVTPHKTTHGSVQPDNISAEFNSKPSSSRDEFITNHKLIMSDLEGIIKPLGLEVFITPSVIANKKLLTHIDAIMAGCEPDINVWLGKMNTPPSFNGGLRAAGGHLHIAFEQADAEGREGIMARFDFIKACDLMLGVPSVLLDNDKRRRTLYGKAGATRLKFTRNGDSYNGAEYRTLSNFWLKSEELMGWAFDQVVSVKENLEALSSIAKENSESIISIINNGDTKGAKSLVKRYSDIYEGGEVWL
jgi:hypothetical protein